MGNEVGVRATGGEKRGAERQRGLGAEGSDGTDRVSLSVSDLGRNAKKRDWRPLRPSGTLGCPPPFCHTRKKKKTKTRTWSRSVEEGGVGSFCLLMGTTEKHLFLSTGQYLPQKLTAV